MSVYENRYDAEKCCHFIKIDNTVSKINSSIADKHEHFHKNVQFIFTKNGTANVQVCGENIQLNGDSILFIDSLEPHLFFSASNCNCL